MLDGQIDQLRMMINAGLWVMWRDMGGHYRRVAAVTGEIAGERRGQLVGNTYVDLYNVTEDEILVFTPPASMSVIQEDPVT